MDIFYNLFNNKYKSKRNENFCALGIGDCGSDSKSTIKIENNILTVDKQSIDISTQQLNTLITKNMIDSTQSCSGSGQTIQSVNRNVKTGGGDYHSGKISQTSNISIDFSCVNSQDIKDTTSSQMMLDLMAGLESNTNQEALTKMSAIADATTTTGVGSSFLTAPATSNSNVEMTNKYQNISDKSKKISNIIANQIDKTFSAKILEDCRTQALAQQSVDETVDTGGGKFIGDTITQATAFDIVGNCIQKSGMANDIVNSVASTFDIKTKDTSTQKSSVDANASATATSKASGIEDVISSFGTLISNLLTGIFGSLLLPFIICIIICVLCMFSSSFAMFMGNRQQQQQPYYESE